MANKERERVTSPEEIYTAEIAEFPSLLYSDRQMVVCHLKANPEKQEEIIAGYLQSPELLEDPDTFGEFLSFWLQEFFQRVDTGPIENLLAYIKTADADAFPRELQRAKKVIFEPFFKLTNGKEEEIFSKVRILELSGVARLLGKVAISSEKQLPTSLKNQYLEYVDQLVRLEARIAVPKPVETKITPPKRTSSHIPPLATLLSPESFLPPETEYSYFIVLGPNTKPTQIENPEQLSELMRKIKGLPQEITSEVVWQHLVQLLEISPIDIMEKYKERVAGGPFKSWRKIALGRKWLIIFQIQNSEILFRVGPHEDVYATGRRKPRDRARSL